MIEKDPTAIQREIEEILIREWDPLGIAAQPECRNQYSCYVAGVYRLLAQGASESELAEHLALKEQQQMGLTSPSRLLEKVARLLRSVEL